jgi:hypothetical protein
MIPEFYLYIILGGMFVVACAVIKLSLSIDMALTELVIQKKSYIDVITNLKKTEQERPQSVEAQEILHDLTAHGKAVLLIQKIGMDEILLRPKRGE